MLSSKLLLLVVLVVVEVNTEFPQFIRRCNKNDPNFDKCLFNNANLALPFILNGVPELYLPNINNFRTGALDYDATEFLHFHSDDAVAISKNISLEQISFDTENSVLKFRTRSGHSKWRLNFIANGTILGKPILEKGYANMTLYNIDFTFEAKLETKNIDGVKHYQISDYINSYTEFEKFEFVTFDQDSLKKPMSRRQQKIFYKCLPAIEFSMGALMGPLGAQVSIFILNTIFMLVPQEEVFLS